jgi:hypothetical protein
MPALSFNPCSILLRTALSNSSTPNRNRPENIRVIIRDFPSIGKINVIFSKHWKTLWGNCRSKNRFFWGIAKALSPAAQAPTRWAKEQRDEETARSTYGADLVYLPAVEPKVGQASSLSAVARLFACIDRLEACPTLWKPQLLNRSYSLENSLESASLAQHRSTFSSVCSVLIRGLKQPLSQRPVGDRAYTFCDFLCFFVATNRQSQGPLLGAYRLPFRLRQSSGATRRG